MQSSASLPLEFVFGGSLSILLVFLVFDCALLALRLVFVVI